MSLLLHSRFRSGFVLASFAAAFAPALSAAEVALDRLVPEDAALVAAVENLPSLRTRLGVSPLGRAWNDPEVQKFIAPLFANADYLKLLEQVKAETGYAPEELLGFATGDILFSVPVSSLKFEKSRFNADAILIVEVGDNDSKLRDLIARRQAGRAADPSLVETTEDYNGATLHTLALHAPKTDATVPVANEKAVVWAIHEGRAYLSTSRALVVGALDAAAAGGLAQPLASAPRYRTVLDRAGGHPDYVFFADFQSVYPLLLAGIEASADPAQPPNPMGIEPLGLFKAFGLDALGVASATGVIAPDGSSSGDAVLTYTEARGVINLLAYRDGPVARPDWIPAAWNNVSSQNFSIPDLYAELEQTLDRISPMLAGMATGQIKAFDRQLKIDLKRDLVGNFGPNIISGVAAPADASVAKASSYDELEQFFAVSLADSAAFERTVDALKTRFLAGKESPLQKRDYLGRTMYVFTPPAGAKAGSKGFAYAVTDGWLLLSIGSAAPLETVLQRMNKSDPAGSFWARADVRAALEGVPAAAFSVQFTDLPSAFASLCALGAKVQGARGADASPLFDASATPTAETFAKYFSYALSHGERKADGLYFKTYTPAVPVR